MISPRRKRKYSFFGDTLNLHHPRLTYHPRLCYYSRYWCTLITAHAVTLPTIPPHIGVISCRFWLRWLSLLASLVVAFGFVGCCFWLRCLWQDSVFEICTTGVFATSFGAESGHFSRTLAGASFTKINPQKYKKNVFVLVTAVNSHFTIHKMTERTLEDL